jgi:upstream activation factor subunit UAF30
MAKTKSTKPETSKSTKTEKPIETPVEDENVEFEDEEQVAEDEGEEEEQPKVETKKTDTKTKKTDTKKADTKKPKAVDVKKAKADTKKKTKKSEGDSETDPSEKKKKRGAPSREEFLVTFDELVSSIEKEIEGLRESKTKVKGVKFLRTLNKQIKLLKSQASRVIKQKNTTRKNGNSTSGFLKPVKISKEMAKFTGWDETELRSRVDVTKYLCNYIKENNLQNPADKRQIQVDSKLSKLLKFDSKKEPEPLTYYRLQTYLKTHFIKPEPAVAVAV